MPEAMNAAGTRRGLMAGGLRWGGTTTGAAAGAAALAACGLLDQRSPEPSGPKPLRSDVTVSWASYITNVPLAEEVNALWSQKHPTVKIAYDLQGVGLTKLLAAMAAGTPPEVSLSLYGDVPKLQPQVANLAPYMRRDRFPERDFFPPALEQYRYSGNSYALPYDFPIRCVWYNAGMFRDNGVKLPPAAWDDPGWTWDDFAEAARRLVKPNPSQPAETVWGVRWGTDVPTVFECMYFLLNNGTGFVNADGKEVIVTEPAAVEALQFMQDLIQRWRVARTRADVQQVPGDRFAAGKLAMDIFRPVQIAAYRRDLTFEWALAPLPRGPRGKTRTTIMGGSAWVLPAGNQNKEEAWALMQHLVGAEVERAQIKHVGIMAARRAVLDEYAAQEPPQNMRLVIRAAEAANLLPKTPWWSDAQQLANPLLDELWTGAKSATVVAQEAKRQIDPILKQPYQFKAS